LLLGSMLRRRCGFLARFGAITLFPDIRERQRAADREYDERDGRDCDCRAARTYPPPGALATRVRVCLDKPSGLESPKLVGKLARGRITAGRISRHRLVDDADQVTRRSRG